MAHTPIIWTHIVDDLWRVRVPCGWLYADQKLKTMQFVPRLMRPEIAHFNHNEAEA